MVSVAGALETLNLSERLGSYIHSLSHITQETPTCSMVRERKIRVAKTLERERGRERGGGEEREGVKRGISHRCQAINYSLSGSFRSFSVFQTLELVLVNNTVLRPSWLTLTSWPCPFPPLSRSLRATGASADLKKHLADLSSTHCSSTIGDKNHSLSQKHSVTHPQKGQNTIIPKCLISENYAWATWHKTILPFSLFIFILPNFPLCLSCSLSLFPLCSQFPILYCKRVTTRSW